ncbi:MAG: hypothetical protein Q8P49_00350 [Candidatus Liptonbacteria bacterium]|nr:hypothetical protein [Candidatus Liptonbacteria bacterium]
MSRESPKQDDPESRERRENEIFDFEIDDASRCINFAGSKDDVIDFLARLLACSIAHNPDREGYMRMYRSHKADEERDIGSWFEDPGHKGRSYAFTALPFRLYIRTADSAQPHILEKLKMKPNDSRWIVRMLTNSSEYNDEERQRTWKEVKDNFERVRQEMIAERGGAQGS